MTARQTKLFAELMFQCLRDEGVPTAAYNAMWNYARSVYKEKDIPPMLDLVDSGVIGFGGNTMFNKAFQDATTLKGYLHMIIQRKKERNS
jgi:hypothetical protein